MMTGRTAEARATMRPRSYGLLSAWIATRRIKSLLALSVSFSCLAATSSAVEPSNIFDPVTVSSSLWLLENEPDDEEDELDDDLAVDRIDLDNELDVDGDTDDDEDLDEDSPNANLNRSIYGDAEARQPAFEDGRFVLPSLMAPTTNVSEIGNGRQAEDFRGEESTPLIGLPESLFDRGLPGGYTVRNWAAPNTFSHPRYFEDRMLERHGHERFACVQPFASGFRFFATIPMLPYLAVVREPCECEYTLGYYRTGSCAPDLLQRPPYERRAVIAEALTIAGASAALP